MKDKKGFTIVELICVIGVLIILIGIFSLNMINSMRRNTDDAKSNVIAQVKSAADAYVAANPEAVKKLYEGYGYVDIPVGDLRNGGALNEEIRDPETGDIIPDDAIVRVILNGGDYMEFIYPVDTDQEAWLLHAEPLTVEYNASIDRDTWCDAEADKVDRKRVFAGLITGTDLSSTEYAKITSKIYLMNNDEEGSMYSGDYFKVGENEVNLTVEDCNVNPKKEGLYNVTYKYYDPKLKTEKKQNRTVYVAANDSDITRFEVVSINDGQEIMQLTPTGGIKIVIKEYLRGGENNFNIIETTVGELPSRGYNITNFSTDELALDGRDALISSRRVNSDGSTPEAQYKKYVVVPAEFDIYFDAQGGSVSPTKVKVKYKETYNKNVSGSGTNGFPSTASRTGYTFLGWFSDPTGGVEIKATTQVLDVSIRTLYAHWKPIPYTISYNSDGGSPSSYPSNSINFGDNYVLPSGVPTKSGYDFMGWYTGRNGSGIKVTTSTPVNTANNHTLYAYWRGKPYNVTFDPNGGSGSKQTITEYYGSPYTLPYSNPSKTGYNFDGWYTSPSGGSRVNSGTIMNTAGDHTLYAHYSEITYTLYYDANGGYVSPSSKTIRYSSNTIGSLPRPSMTGYNFLGWYYGNSSRVYESDTVNSDTWIYAHWEKINYYVTFNANGGYPTPSSRYVGYGESYGYIDTPSRDGYTFAGWYTGNSCTGSRVYSYDTNYTASNHTVYACWNKNVEYVTINFYRGDTGAKIDSRTYEKGSYISAPYVTPPCAYKLIAWNTSSSGSGSIMPTYANNSASYYAIFVADSSSCSHYSGCSDWLDRMISNGKTWAATHNTPASAFPGGQTEKNRIEANIHACSKTVAKTYCNSGTGGNGSGDFWYSNSKCNIPTKGTYYFCYDPSGTWYYTSTLPNTVAKCRSGTPAWY